MTGRSGAAGSEEAGPGDGLRHLTSLYQATRRIGLSESLDDLVEEVLDRARELVGFDHCALMLYDPASETLTVRKVRGYGHRRSDVLGLCLPLDRGLSGWAARHRTAVRVGDVTRDARYVTGLEQALSNLAVPLLAGGELAGVLNVESERRDAFTETHEKLLTVLGAQAALAILASRARAELEARIRRLDALYRIGRLASGETDLDGTLHAILQVARELVPEGQVAILLRDPKTGDLRLRAAEGYEEASAELRIPEGRGVTGRAVTTGEPVVVHDVEDFDDYIPGVPGARSEIAIPLEVEHRVIGVFNAESTRPHAFDAETRRLLTVVARQVAAVVHSVGLHEEARRLATLDPLTGLHNRRHFFGRLGEQLGRAERYGGRMALLLMDVDQLKELNDTHGHAAGDAALVALGRLLVSSLRESDEVARIGGDEFAALLLETDSDLARNAIARIRTAFRALHEEDPDSYPLPVTVSLGLAFHPEDGHDTTTLMQRADQALYHAKRHGRDRLARWVDGRLALLDRDLLEEDAPG